MYKITMSGRVHYTVIILLASMITFVLSLIPFFHSLILPVWVIAGFCILITYYYMQSHYIRIDDKGIHVNRGVFNLKTLYIPYSSIDNVGIGRSLLERVFGLAELTVDTRGGPETELVMKYLPYEEVTRVVSILKERSKHE